MGGVCGMGGPPGGFYLYFSALLASSFAESGKSSLGLLIGNAHEQTSI